MYPAAVDRLDADGRPALGNEERPLLPGPERGLYPAKKQPGLDAVSTLRWEWPRWMQVRRPGPGAALYCGGPFADEGHPRLPRPPGRLDGDAGLVRLLRPAAAAAAAAAVLVVGGDLIANKLIRPLPARRARGGDGSAIGRGGQMRSCMGSSAAGRRAAARAAGRHLEIGVVGLRHRGASRLKRHRGRQLQQQARSWPG